MILIVVGGIGGIVALTVAYRRQRYSEAAEDRERVRTFTDRMVKAVEQLGHERAGVRVAGAYALAHLADEWDDGQQMCVDVFCAYIRMPYDPDGDRAKDGEREVRRTMFRIIRDHLRPDPYWGHVKWSACRFSFEGAVIDQCDLSGIHLAEHGHITFHRVRFVDGLHLSHMRLNNGRMWFTGATFAGRYADFSQADLTAGRVTFDGSEFAGGKTTFTGVTHDAGKVTFDGAVHTGGRVDWGPFAALPAPAARPTRSMRRTVGSFIRRGL